MHDHAFALWVPFGFKHPACLLPPTGERALRLALSLQMRRLIVLGSGRYFIWRLTYSALQVLQVATISLTSVLLELFLEIEHGSTHTPQHQLSRDRV